MTSKTTKTTKTAASEAFPSKTTSIIILTIIILVIITIQTYLISLNGTLAWDEVVYLANAKAKIEPVHFQEDFRFPAIATIIAALWKITGESILATQILMIIITAITTIIFYLITKQITQNYTLSLISATLLGLSSQYIIWGSRIYTDILSIGLILASFLLLLKQENITNNKKEYEKIKKQTNKHPELINKIKTKINKKHILIFLSGALAGIAFATRLSTIIIAMILAIFFLLRKNWLKNTFIYSTGFIISILPLLISGLKNHNNPLYFALAQTSAILEYTAREPITNLIKFMINEHGLILILMFFVTLIFLDKTLHLINSKKYTSENKKENNKNNNTETKSKNHKQNNYQNHNQNTNLKFYAILIITLFLANLAFYAYFVKLKLARYLIAISPFTILLIILGIHAILNTRLGIKKIKNKTIIITIIILLISASAIYNTYENFNELKTQKKCTANGALAQSIKYIQNISVPGQTIISSVWPYYGYYANLKAHSPWDENISLLIKIHDPDYFIFSTKAGVPVTKPIQNENVKKTKEYQDECGFDIIIYEVQK